MEKIKKCLVRRETLTESIYQFTQYAWESAWKNIEHERFYARKEMYGSNDYQATSHRVVFRCEQESVCYAIKHSYFSNKQLTSIQGISVHL